MVNLGSDTPLTQCAGNVIQGVHLFFVLMGLLFFGLLNAISLKITYSVYGDVNGHNYSFFANQCNNLLYIIIGGSILYPRMFFTKTITPEMRKFPQSRFFMMALLDALGGFATSLGAPRTPGQLQPVLNQTLIPLTMMIAAIYLNAKFNCWKISGAILIAFGAVLCALPDILATTNGQSSASSVSIFFYAISNIPMAASAVYKEKNFKRAKLDVWYMTQSVSIYQFAITFLFTPLLILPVWGDASNGVHSFQEILSNMSGGASCYVQQIPECAYHNSFLWMTGYTVVNVIYNVLGLYVTKHAGAAFSSICYSLLLPLTSIVWFTPIVGSFQEPFTQSSWATIGAVAVSMAGFLCYQRTTVLRHLTPKISKITYSQLPKKDQQNSLQDRIIGLDFLEDGSPMASRDSSKNAPLL